MRPAWLLLLSILFSLSLAPAAKAAETPVTDTTTVVEPVEPEQPFSADEGDSKTPSLTPISSFEQRKPYDQARETLVKAQDLWKKGNAKLAGETALEAYDDLIAIRVSRKQKQARRKLLSERHQAAQVYIEATIAYIKEHVTQSGDSPAARADGRTRLSVLRDVSRDYPELNNKVTQALNAWQAS